MNAAEALVRSSLSSTAPADWRASGRSKAAYLDLAEIIVRAAASWMDADGAIIDPVEHEEWGQSSSRFISSAAVLLAHGRCTELREHVLTAMDRCCTRLAKGEAHSPDFWTRELMTAYNSLKDLEPDRATGWAQDLATIIPESIYWQVEKPDTPIDALHNWTIYAAAGESMRAQAGLGPRDCPQDTVWGYGFFDKYMPAQQQHFSEYGMYRDPGDPITYDLTTRLQLTVALQAGAGGAQRAHYDDFLRTGGFATLLLVSPDGLVPFGGRSSQYHFQELIVSALCEYEAKRWKEQGPLLAGAFKRQARLSLQAVEPWFTQQPFTSLKNRYPPANKHGYDSYGKYAVYSLLTASFCGLAAQIADDSIDEHPCPAELGGYVWQIAPAFHKVIATCQSSHLVIDTCADQHYDATGLGRLCMKQAPPALMLGMPLCGDPHYQLPAEHIPAAPACFGPEWKDEQGNWHRLAALQAPQAQLDRKEQTPTAVSFSVHYDGLVSEDYRLENHSLTYCFHVLATETRLVIPILVTDGQLESSVSIADKTVTVSWDKWTVQYSFPDATALDLDAQLQANRNGCYRLLYAHAARQCRVAFSQIS